MIASIARVAVPVPLRQSFDFLLPAELDDAPVGARVRVPFGRRELIGILVSKEASSEVPLEKLKPIKEVIDEESVFGPELWSTLQWLSNYYLAPIGEVTDTALPVLLRQGHPLKPASETRWRLSEHGRSAASDELARAPLQLAIVKRFVASQSLGAEDFAQESRGWRAAIRSLVKKGWLEELSSIPQIQPEAGSNQHVELNGEQQHAAQDLLARISAEAFSCTLLHGVTGSGKTEVYFTAMRAALALEKQVLLLVPEIGLTPQLIQRVKQSFDCPVVVLHSGLTDQARHTAWWHARQGNAGIVIGTRSAVFVPLKSPGLVVVDEEHDNSLKQQDGVRYQARDVAIYRANRMQVPIVLGSATPSIESLHNAQNGRYHLAKLSKRATKAALPKIELINLRNQPARDGLSPALVNAIKTTLAATQQVMIFLNRRGYAPVLYCAACGTTSQCHRCDSNLTFHQTTNRLRCHHCGFEGRATGACSACKQQEMVEIGEGTQRVEDALNELFPTARILRIDRDSTTRKGELEAKLAMVMNQDVDIVLGTQLLAKGHDFPGVKTVGILGADQGLYSTDFRARENLFQQLLQVAGRAGRHGEAGTVYVQTAFPNEEFFAFAQAHDFDGFAAALLQEREATHFPPFGYFAVLRAESTHQTKAMQFLRRVRQNLAQYDDVLVMDAVAAPMERRAGRYRAQLLFNGRGRRQLNTCLQECLRLIQAPELKQLSNSVRWSLDVDPSDLF